MNEAIEHALETIGGAILFCMAITLLLLLEERGRMQRSEGRIVANYGIIATLEQE